jgi:hypothetical protein
LQFVVPFAHELTHAPAEHTSVGRQATRGQVLALQALGSVEVSTQLPLHSLRPARHPQWPPLHSCSAAQAMLHAPQFSGLLAVFTHSEPHSVRPASHLHDPI